MVFLMCLYWVQAHWNVYYSTSVYTTEKVTKVELVTSRADIYFYEYKLEYVIRPDAYAMDEGKLDAPDASSSEMYKSWRASYVLSV